MGLLRACADVPRRRARGRMAASPRSIWSPGAGLPAGGGRVRGAAGAARPPPTLEVAVLTRTRPRRPRAIPRSPPARSSSPPTQGAGAARARARRGADRRRSGEELDPARRDRRAARPRALADPLRGRAARDRAVPRRRPRRRALPHRLAAPPRPRRLRPAPRARRGRRPAPAAARSRAGLLGVRRDGDHLFLRYRLDRDPDAPPGA